MNNWCYLPAFICDWSLPALPLLSLTPPLPSIPESIQRFLVDFLVVVWFGSSPTPSPHSVSSTGDDTQLKLRKRDNLLTREGEGVGEEPYHATARKPGPLQIIQYSLLQPLYLPSPFHYCLPFPGSTLANSCHSLSSGSKEWSNFYCTW
jgi:hypothetical protein